MLGEQKGRWSRELTEGELRWTLAQRSGLLVIEWPAMNQTFIGHRESLRIIRAGALGGDVRVIHGGWQYLGDILYLLDWRDIQYVGNEPVNRRIDVRPNWRLN